MKRSVPILLLVLAGSTAGCAVRDTRPKTMPQVTAQPAAPAGGAVGGRAAPPALSYEDEIRRSGTITELWTVMNRHHDELGRLLQVRRAGAVALTLRGAFAGDKDGRTRRPAALPSSRAVRETEKGRVKVAARPEPLGKEPATGRRGDAAGDKAKTETKAARQRVRLRHYYRTRPARVCARVCQHVKAICYASSRICTIAASLGELPAFLACRRSRVRCVDSRRSAGRYCPPCR